MGIFQKPKYATREPRIDLIRFFLAWFVVFVHIIPWYDFCGLAPSKVLIDFNKVIIKIFQTGFETNPAVLCFITLSGYCIHRNGLRIYSFDLQKFFLRRSFRIFPVFILGLVLGILVFSFFGESEKIQSITGTKNIDFLGLLLKSFALHSFFPYKFSSVYQGNGPLITAGVECWLYVVYPLAFYLIQKYGQKKFWIALVALTGTGALMCQMNPALSSWWHNGSLWGFLIYWYIGVAAVDMDFMSKKSGLFLVGGYILITLFLIFVTNKICALIEIRKCIFSLLFAYGLNRLDRGIWGANVLSKGSDFWQRLLSKFLGAGYSIYAIHVPVIVFCIAYKVSLATSFLMVAVLGYVSFLALEIPFIEWGKKIIRNREKTKTF